MRPYRAGATCGRLWLLALEQQVAESPHGFGAVGDLVLEPLPGYPIIRDLVVDRTQQTIASRKDKRQVTEE